MSHATLAQAVHKALLDAGYTPAQMQESGFIVAGERNGSVTVSHAPTYNLEQTRKYEVALKERTTLKVSLVPLTEELYQLSVEDPRS